jgi:hypothetical protein
LISRSSSLTNAVRLLSFFKSDTLQPSVWHLSDVRIVAKKAPQGCSVLLSVFAARGFIFSLRHLQSLSAADQRSYQDTRDSCGGCDG